MRTRQAKKILKNYLITEGWIRWPMSSLIAAMRVARRRNWTTAFCWKSWNGGKAAKRHNRLVLMARY